MGVYLNSYYPLCHTAFGQKAMQQFGLHPLVDGSIRREPDFSHPLCPISGLCRPGKMRDFRPGHIIVYKTNSSHILTAVLEIDRRFESHKEAADWLTEHGYAIPSNNVLTDPLPLNQSHALAYMDKVGTKGERLDDAIHSHWNNVYLKRGTDSKSSYFFTTKPLYNAVLENVQPKDYLYIDQLFRSHQRSIPRTNWRPEPIANEIVEEIFRLIKK